MNLSIDINQLARRDSTAQIPLEDVTITSPTTTSPPLSARHRAPSTATSPLNSPRSDYSPRSPTSPQHLLASIPSYLDMRDDSTSTSRVDTGDTFDTTELDDMLQNGFVKNGCCGILERLPLFVKLVIMISVALIGMVIIGIILMQEQAQIINHARNNKRFSSIMIITGNLIHQLQEERYLAQTYLNSGGGPVGDKFTTQQALTQKDLVKFNNFVRANDYQHYLKSTTATSDYNTMIGQLDAYRTNVTLLAVTFTQTTTYYTNTVNILTKFMVNFVDGSVSSRITSPFLMLIDYKESLSKIRATISIIATKHSATGQDYIDFVTFVANQRLMETFLSKYADTNLLTKFTGAYNTPTNQQLYIIETTVVNKPTNITYSELQWISLANGKLTIVQELLDMMGDLILNNSQKNLRDSTIRVTIFLVIICVFWILSIGAAIILSQAITGPWKRLILMQESMISKFVPKELLRMLKCYRLSDLTVGQNVERELAVVFTTIQNFATVTENMNNAERFNFLNEYLAYIGPTVRKFGGYIDKFLGDSLMICYQTANDSMYSMLEMQSGLGPLAESKVEVHQMISKLQIGMGIHAGKSGIGTVGENQRIEATVLSDVVPVATRMQVLARVFKARIITPNDVIKKLKQPILFPFRPIGYVRMGGKRQYIKVYEILDKMDTKKIDTLHDFRLAVQCMIDHNHDRSLEIFERILNRNPDDAAARIIRLSCQSYKVTFEMKARDITVQEIMHNRILREMFSQFCKEERSEENFKFWLAVDQYTTKTSSEDRLETAKNIYRKFLAKDARTLVNTSEQQTNVIVQAIQNSELNNQQFTMESTLFENLRVEAELLLHDTFTRYKKSSRFIDAMKKTMPVPIVNISDEDTL
jgi:class 3 adenylate cyclase